jgi:hypothetical protein
MPKHRAPLPMPDPRRHAPKRHFKGLMMPPVPHPPGAPIESCEPPTSPRSRRMAKLLLAVAGLLAFGAIVWSGVVGRSKHAHHPGKPCPIEPTTRGTSPLSGPSNIPSK